MLEKEEFEYQPAVEVSNIVATADLGSNISLEVLTIELGMERTEYEPEQFPALIYRGSESIMLVFQAGSFSVLGLLTSMLSQR